MAAGPGSATAGGIERHISASGFPSTLTVPAGNSDAPNVLILSGSGPTNRDGDNPAGVSAGYLGKLARALADRGIASLRYDKRGVAGSVAVPDESALTFQTFVDDAGTVLDWLRERTGGKPLALVGHSEGGLVALELANSRTDVDRVVLLTTPGRPPAAVLREQIERNLAGPLRWEALDILIEIETGRTVENIPGPLQPLFRPSVQPFLRSLFALDPAGRLAALRAQALVIGGGRDLQIGRADFDALKMRAPSASFAWLPRMNHVLAEVDDDIRANLAAYADPTAPLAPELVETITDFVRREGREDAPHLPPRP